MDWSGVQATHLFQACGEPNSADAWREFMRRYHYIVTASAVRVSRQWGLGTSDEIDDVVQEIYLRLCEGQAAILTGFKDERPEACFGYLKVVNTNIARDYFRHKAAYKRGAAITTSLDQVAELRTPALEIERNLSLAEIDDALSAETQKPNGERDRAVFKLYYRYGMTAQAIAALPGISLTAKGVEGVLHRLTRAIRSALSPTQNQQPGPAQGLAQEMSNE